MTAFLASALLVANTTKLLYENTTTGPLTVNIRAANQNNTGIQYWVAMGSGADPEAKDCITPNVPVGGNEPWEDTGLRMSPGEKIWIKATKGNVSVRVHGVAD